MSNVCGLEISLGNYCRRERLFSEEESCDKEEHGMGLSICGILEAEKVGSRQVWSKGDKSFSYKDLAPHQKP